MKNIFLTIALLISIVAVFSSKYVLASNVQTIQIQILLSSLGYDIGEFDGVFGKRTLESLKSFQEKNNIRPSGIIDFETRRLIFTLSQGRDPYEHIDEKDILWVKSNMIGYDSIEQMYTAQTRETIFINHLLREKVLMLQLSNRKDSVIADASLLTVNENVRNRIINAMKSIELETSWSEYPDSNLEALYQFLGNVCSGDCSGHYAGFEWAAVNSATHSADCSNHSDSFKRGCNLFVNGN